MTAGHDAVRRLLGAYVLGGLDDTDQHTVDAHLSTCAECRAEVGRLAAVPELLQRLPEGPGAPLEPPSRAGLDAFLRRARPRRLPILALSAACLILAIVVGILALRPTAAPVPPLAAPSPAVSVSAGTEVQFIAAAGSGLSGRALLTPRQWGVSVSLELAGLSGDGPFMMKVLDRGGQAEQAACWGRTQSAQARVTGASSIQLADVDSIQIADHDGKTLGSARLR
ncbi:anti-sigma factor family protein [Dactylosporangium matsuzakiense]|uniref:Anti-sigma factor n=1 Tax=Dactylosporangium matsuzakiense TaxID=53360 RepID=A0A9W6KM21_9ACTN|nr:zf-HC2 domain-containing protein [Dactylosporangium matsuzakiense]UWZ43253.1 zf-HC2 domain-containing protein [Dactylosporangium matsuzakiense]GLL02645.1 anti-sigma factor [Dactylosporangium matsuzakiense]